jgi:hypothetical protein
MILFLLKIPDEDRLLPGHNEGGYPCPQRSSLSGLSYPFVHPQAIV